MGVLKDFFKWSKEISEKDSVIVDRDKAVSDFKYLLKSNELTLSEMYYVHKIISEKFEKLVEKDEVNSSCDPDEIW